MPYIFIFLYFVLMSIIFDYGKQKKGYNLFYFLGFVCLVLLLGLRYRVGGDSLNYEDSYPYFPSLSELSTIEIGSNYYQYQPLWYLICALCKSINGSFILFQFVHAIIVNGALFIYFKKYATLPFITVLIYFVLYFFYYNTEIMRESLSVISFMFAWPHLINRRYVNYYIWAFIAFQFHISAIILFLFPLMYRFLNKKYNFNLTILCILLLILFSGTILSTLLNGVLEIGILNEAGAHRAISYSSTSTNINGVIMGIIHLLPPLLMLKIINRTGETNNGNYFILNMILILQVFSVSFALGRFLNYFQLLFLVMICNQIPSYKLRVYNRLRPLMIILISVIFITRTYYYTRDMSYYNYRQPARFYNLYVPYHTIFNPIVEPTRENIFYNQFDN